MCGDAALVEAELKGLLRDLRKTMKARQIYAHIPDHGQGQVRAIHGRLDDLLRTVGELSLRVEVSSLYWNDVEVFNDESHDFNFGYSLYRAGVRLLIFSAGIHPSEFERFWTHLVGDLNHRGDEDLLTRLWREGFEGIRWVAQTKLIEDEGVDLIYNTLATNVLGRFSFEDLKARHGEFLSRLTAEFERQAAQRVQSNHRGSASPTLDASAEKARTAAGFSEVLLEVARLHSFPEATEAMAVAAETLTAQLLQDAQGLILGSFGAHALLAREQETRPLQARNVGEILDGVGRAMRAPHHADSLVAMATSSDLPPSVYATMLRLIGDEGTTVLLSLLDASLRPEPRNLTLRALARTPVKDVALIARRIRSAEERQACELLDVIMTMELPRRSLVCEAALSSSSRGVRIKAIHLLGRCDDQTGAVQVLSRHLEKSTDAEVRALIIEALGVTESAEADHVLLTNLRRENCEAAEAAQTWVALLSHPSLSGQSEAELVASAPTRGMFGVGRGESRKAALVEALGMLGGVWAIKLLTVIATTEEGRTSRALLKRAQELLAGLRRHIASHGSR